MKLYIKDRIMFEQFYPEKGDIIEQILIRDLDKKVVLTQADMETYNIKSEKGRIRWNAEKDEGIDVEFTDAELSFLKEQVEKLDKAKSINQGNLELCLKIRG